MVSDVPGRKALRGSWQAALAKAQAICFVVDSTDVMRLPIVEEELGKITAGFAQVPTLVLATKQDLGGALSGAELSQRLRPGEGAGGGASPPPSPSSSPRRTNSDFRFYECSAANPASITNALLDFVQIHT